VSRRQGTALTIAQAASPRDLDDVAAMEAECFTNPWTREMLEREMRTTGVVRIYTARDAAGTLVAFCTCWLVVDELHINTLAVDAAHRRAGIGTALMRYVLDDAVHAGAVRSTLEVRASNAAARRLYASLGFAESAVRARYYSQPEEDGIILWLELR
jgi:ribosomal-protein-alanine N-acetyltransferase